MIKLKTLILKLYSFVLPKLSVKENKESFEKELYNLVFENSGLAVFLVNVQSGIIVDCNRTALTLLECDSKNDIIGQDRISFSPVLQPDGQNSIDRMQEHIVRAKGQNGYSYEHTKVTSSGREFWVEVTLSFIKIKGEEYIYASWKDVDDRKTTESIIKNQQQVLRESQRLSKTGSWSLDLVSGKLTWSDEIYKIFEIEKNVEPSYTLFLNTIHPEDRDTVNSAYKNSLKDKKKYEIVHRLLMTNGDIKYVQEQCETNFDKLGVPLNSFGTVQDISAHKLTEVQLAQNQVLLLQQARYASAGEMIGNISHQWRQPLNALGLTIQKLGVYNAKNALDDEKITEIIDKSMGLISGMSTTIDDFRHFFKPEKDKTVFLLKDSIIKGHSIIEASLKNNYINYSLEMEDESIKFNGHFNEFSQVIINLLTNAKDALLEKNIIDGCIQIKVSNDIDNIYIEILDNGGGISKDAFPKLFEPYFTTKANDEGTGIGLYMSKIIIEEHHAGKVEVSNTENGACFRVAFPR